MNKNNLKRYIAKTAYNVGFGAKKNFASYDIVRNLNEYISILSMIVAVLALVFEVFNAKIISAILLIFGIIGLYISKFDKEIDDFEKFGIKFLQLYNKLEFLYHKIDDTNESDYASVISEIESIENEFYGNNKSKQVYFSDWLAHFKFFYQFQTKWIVNELGLNFWKDKVPNSLKFIFIVVLIFLVLCVGLHFFNFIKL